VIEYPCAKFGDFSFSRFGFIVRTDRHTHTDRITDPDDRYTHATAVGVSNDNSKRGQKLPTTICQITNND